jgi:hypothetical protein
VCGWRSCCTAYAASALFCYVVLIPRVLFGVACKWNAHAYMYTTSFGTTRPWFVDDICPSLTHLDVLCPFHDPRPQTSENDISLVQGNFDFSAFSNMRPNQEGFSPLPPSKSEKIINPGNSLFEAFFQTAHTSHDFFGLWKVETTRTRRT